MDLALQVTSRALKLLGLEKNRERLKSGHKAQHVYCFFVKRFFIGKRRLSNTDLPLRMIKDTAIDNIYREADHCES